jgi:hypothetical protein
MISVRTQAARNTDPVTSHMAIEAMNESGARIAQQKIILNIVTIFPGWTAAEYARKLQQSGIDLDHVQVQRRLSDLCGVSIKKGSITKCTVKGSKMVTWLPIKESIGESI